nr:low molecular weight protein arginine phosphatase [Pantoea sp. 201603H]
MKILFAMCLLTLSVATSASEHLITFVCRGNTGRSPMAEALSSDLIKKEHLNLKVQSRGLNVVPKEISPEEGTVAVLKERGINISNHKATQLTEDDIKKSSLILTMTEEHKHKILAQNPQAKNKVFTLYEYTTGKHEDLSDPYGKPLSAYRALEVQFDKLLPVAINKASGELE